MGSEHHTLDAIFYCTETFRKAIDNKKTVAFSLLVLSKAFDSFDHTYLKQKLKELNFSEEAIEKINSFIANRSQKTIVNNTQTRVSHRALSRVFNRALSLAL